MRFNAILKPITKVANVVGPVVSIAEGISFVYDVATYKDRTRREQRERDIVIKKNVIEVYSATADARKELIKNEVQEYLAENLSNEVTAQLNYILLEKQRREKVKKDGPDSE